MNQFFLTENNNLIDVATHIDNRKLKKLQRKTFMVKFDDILVARIFSCMSEQILVLLYMPNKKQYLLSHNDIYVSISTHKAKIDICKKSKKWKTNIKTEMDYFISDYIDSVDKKCSITVPIYYSFQSKSEYLKWKLQV